LYNNKIYIIGGSGGVANMVTCVFDPLTYTIQEKGPVYPLFEYGASDIILNKIYVVGGSREGSETETKYLQMYDPLMDP
jgi:hypothetical protein